MVNYDFPSKQWYYYNLEVEVGIDEAKATVTHDIERFASKLREFYVKDVSPFEAASWAIKIVECQKIQSGGTSPLIALEAQMRGVGQSILVTKIMELANQLSILEASISGMSGRHRDAVYNMTTIQEVLDYDWSTGWPLG